MDQERQRPRPRPAVGRRLVSGRLDLAFAADGDGRTYLQRQYASYPFHVCRVHYHDKDHPGLATLYVQSCSGGIYEDDRLDLTLATAAGRRSACLDASRDCGSLHAVGKRQPARAHPMRGRVLSGISA